MRPKISVIVIAKNEGEVIAKCLESVHGWADEILVLDSGSSDNTVEVSKRYATRVVETDWPGYGKQKIKATSMTQYDWVLSIDADEVMSQELKDEIDRNLQRLSDSGCTGIKVSFRLSYFGKMVRSVVKRQSLVLFNKQYAGFLDVPIHEVVVVDKGKVKKLKGYIYHYGSDSLFDQNAKFNRYAKLWSEAKFENGKKANLLKAVIHSIVIFIKTYILYGGFIDGWRGALLSIVYANYTLNKYAQLMVLNKLRATKN